MSPYFYVNRVALCDTCTTTPSFRHTTLKSARTEAERLANKHPGVEFEILKCIAVSQVKAPACTVFMDGEAPDDKRPATF